MNAQPSDRDSSHRRPLGGAFWIFLFGPIVSFLPALMIVDGGGDHRLPVVLVWIAGCFAVVSSIACAIIVGIRSGGVAGFLTCCALVLVYGAISLAGASAVLWPSL